MRGWDEARAPMAYAGEWLLFIAAWGVAHTAFMEQQTSIRCHALPPCASYICTGARERRAELEPTRRGEDAGMRACGFALAAHLSRPPLL